MFILLYEKALSAVYHLNQQPDISFKKMTRLHHWEYIRMIRFSHLDLPGTYDSIRKSCQPSIFLINSQNLIKLAQINYWEDLKK